MAKKKKEETSTAIASVDESALLEAFGDFDFEHDATGLEEADKDDIRFPSLIWNLTKKVGDRFLRKDEFFNTIDEITLSEVRCAFVFLHKTLDFSYFDNATDETKRVCSSYDRIEGTARMTHPKLPQVVEGTVRACGTCPDQQWARNDEGKRSRNCGDVYNVFAIALDDDNRAQTPFMIRFKKTSLAPFRQHLQKHHLGRMKHASGKISDVPLFAYQVSITLQMDDSGKYAAPVLTRGVLLSRETIGELAEQAKTFREMAADVSKSVEAREASSGGDYVEASGESIRDDDFTDG